MKVSNIIGYTKLMDYYNNFDEWMVAERFGLYDTAEKLAAAACANKDKEGIEFFARLVVENNGRYGGDKRKQWVDYFIYVLWHSHYTHKYKTYLLFARNIAPAR